MADPLTFLADRGGPHVHHPGGHRHLPAARSTTRCGWPSRSPPSTRSPAGGSASASGSGWWPLEYEVQGSDIPPAWRAHGGGARDPPARLDRGGHRVRRPLLVVPRAHRAPPPGAAAPPAAVGRRRAPTPPSTGPPASATRGCAARCSRFGQAARASTCTGRRAGPGQARRLRCCAATRGSAPTTSRSHEVLPRVRRRADGALARVGGGRREKALFARIDAGEDVSAPRRSPPTASCGAPPSDVIAQIERLPRRDRVRARARRVRRGPAGRHGPGVARRVRPRSPR